MKELAPIITFVYTRPEHTKKMIESLARNELAKESEIWIFSDNAKNEKAMLKVKQVREYIHSIENNGYFKSVHIIEQEENKGLANSVISGVGNVISNYGKAIVVEDDLILSSTFLTYMNEALDVYKDDKLIWSISGYNPPIKAIESYDQDIYLSYRGCSWGWATWRDRWEMVDWQVSDYSKFKHNIRMRRKFNRGGLDLSRMLDAQMDHKIDSWAIRWCYEQSKREMYTIYPIKSLVYNNGLDGTGTHSGETSAFCVNYYAELPRLERNLHINKKLMKRFRNIYEKSLRGTIFEILAILGLDRII